MYTNCKKINRKNDLIGQKFRDHLIILLSITNKLRILFK